MAAKKRPREEMMVRDLDATRQALRMENQEAVQLRSCFFAVEKALAATDRETAMAEAIAG